MHAHQITKEFERSLAVYTGAPYVVCVNSCTAALLLTLKWHIPNLPSYKSERVSIPKRTYVGVGMSILNAGAKVMFRDEDWSGQYQLAPWPIWDAARRFHAGMYEGGFQCVSFHWSKILGLSQGGAILHNDPVADKWFRRARFDGRTEGVAPADDTFDMLGFHCYLSPEISAHGLMKLALLPQKNDDLPNSDYPDLSKAPIFQR